MACNVFTALTVFTAFTKDFPESIDTQRRMAELFEVQVPAISKHLKNIFEERELEKELTVSIMETVQIENGREIRRKLEYYNLDAIIAVGYRVNSKLATQFRIWSTRVLKEYIIKGFALDDGRRKVRNDTNRM